MLSELPNSLFKIITNSQLAKENINWVNLNISKKQINQNDKWLTKMDFLKNKNQSKQNGLFKNINR